MSLIAEFETVTLRREGPIALLTLNRPARMNAFDQQMPFDLIDAFDATDADPEVRAVIVTGEGKAFCAGADLGPGGATFDVEASAGHLRDTDETRERDAGGRVTLRIFASLKPVIAAINGAAVGIGATMTLPMDIRLAAEGARIGFVFARRGIVPEAASSWFLPRLVGISTALEWCMTGRLIQAAEAERRGLVRSVHAPADLLPAAKAIALEIAEQAAPVSVTLTRQMMWQMLCADHPMEAHRLDSRLIAARGRSADAREGVVSFLEKRPADFPERVPADLPQPFPWWPPRTWR